MGQLTQDIALRAVDTSNNPVPRARLHVFREGTDIYTALYSDYHLTSSQANPMIADSNGYFDDCFLVDGSYRLVLKNKHGEVLYEQDGVEVDTNAPEPGPGPGTDGEASRVFPTVAALLADNDLSYSEAADENQVLVDDILRVSDEGFAYKVAENDATDHHVETTAGVRLYILPRQGVVSLAQWGLTPDGTTDIHPAFQRAVDDFNGVFIPPTDMERLVDTGAWFCSGTINVNSQVHITGIAGTQAGWSKSVIRWPNGVPGFIFHFYDTEGDAQGNVSLNSNPSTAPYAIGSVIEHVTLLRDNGKDTVPDNFSHAIWAKARIGVFNCYISGWAGNGIQIVATATISNPLLRGNANNWTTRDNRVQNCQNGMFVDGADANAGVSMHDDVSSCAEWGLLDSSFLGNTFMGMHTNGNGEDAKRQWNQRQYQCIDASQGPSTEPGTDGDVWWEFGTAGTGSSPTWSSGTVYQVDDTVLASNGRVYRVNTSSGNSNDEPDFDGTAPVTLSDGYRWQATLNEVWKSGEAVPNGGAKSVQNDSSVTTFISCYDESGQAVAYDQSVMAIYPGHGFDQEARGIASYLTKQGWTRIKCERAKADQEIVKYEAFGRLGSDKFSDVHLGYLEVDSLTQTGVATLLDDARGVVVKRDANSDSRMTWMETLHGTTETFGRASPVPHAKYVKQLFVGVNPANARQLTTSGSEPSTGEYARGDVVFDLSASAGGAAGWVCVTSGTAGSTAVFKAMADLAS